VIIGLKKANTYGVVCVLQKTNQKDLNVQSAMWYCVDPDEI